MGTDQKTSTTQTTVWTKEWDIESGRWKLIPPGTTVTVKARGIRGRSLGRPSKTTRKAKLSKGRSNNKSQIKSKDRCCDQKRVLLRSVVRLSASLARYRAKEMEEVAKNEKNKAKRLKAVQRKKEIKLLAEAAEKTMIAIQKGEHQGTYDKFMNKIVVHRYGYNDKDFEKVTSEILKGTVKSANPPKAAVTALKRVEKAAVVGPSQGVASKVINNVQSLVKRNTKKFFATPV